MIRSVGGAWAQESIGDLVQDIAPDYFLSKRWFGSKSQTIVGYRAVDVALLQAEPDPLVLVLLELSYAGGESELYQVPLAFRPVDGVPAALRDQPHGAALVVQTPRGAVWGYDAFLDDAACTALYQGMFDNREVPARHGTVVLQRVSDGLKARDLRTIARVSTEQSNTSIVYNDALIFKAFRKVAAGQNPDVAVPHFLTTSTDFPYVPKVAGIVEYRPGGAGEQAISLGVLQDFVVNQGDGYTNALRRVRDYFSGVLPYIARHPDYTPEEMAEQVARHAAGTREPAYRLGTITGLLHNALASSTAPPDFRAERVEERDTEAWEEGIAGLIRAVVGSLRANAAAVPVQQRDVLEAIAAREDTFLTMIQGLRVLVSAGCHKTRYHGDYHLGQVLETGSDFMILDFEGEPARTLAERQAKHCPLKDVAGMLRSFDYAAYAGLFALCAERQADQREQAELERWALAWEDVAQASFLEGYTAATSRHAGPRFLPADPAAFQRVVEIFEVEKAFYELRYEFNNRPTWIPIPARGLVRLLHTGS
ncbi:MAG: hypothetical protein NVSMB65_02500 [Chloroflexota bacterium]